MNTWMNEWGTPGYSGHISSTISSHFLHIPPPQCIPHPVFLLIPIIKNKFQKWSSLDPNASVLVSERNKQERMVGLEEQNHKAFHEKRRLCSVLSTESSGTIDRTGVEECREDETQGPFWETGVSPIVIVYIKPILDSLPQQSFPVKWLAYSLIEKVTSREFDTRGLAPSMPLCF